MMKIRFSFTCYKHRFVIDKEWNSAFLPQTGHFIEMASLLNSEELEKIRETRLIDDKEKEEFTLEDIMYNEEAFIVESISWMNIDFIRIELDFRKESDFIRIIKKGDNYITSQNFPIYSNIVFSVFLSEIGELFNDKALHFPWHAQFIPRTGDRFDVMDFLGPNDIEYINNSKVEEWATEEGKKDFEQWSKSEWNKGKKFAEWMSDRISNVRIDEMSFSKNREERMNISIWLVECE